MNIRAFFLIVLATSFTFPTFSLAAKAKKTTSPAAETCGFYLQGRRQLLDKSFKIVDGKVKVRFFDVDSTLRKSKSGKLFLKDADDVEILPGVVEKLKKINEEGDLVAAVSNQAANTAEGADQNLLATVKLLRDQGAIIHYYDFAENKDRNRKPDIGMAENLQRVLDMDYHGTVTIDFPNSSMVGDAAYKKGEIRPDKTKGNDFSNSDRMFAVNLKMPFEEARYFFGWKKQKEPAKEKSSPEEVKEKPENAPVVKQESKAKSAGRVAAPISSKDLEKQVFTAWAKQNEEENPSETDAPIINFQELSSQISKDLAKIEFEESEFEYQNPDVFNGQVKNLIGFHTLDNGLTFLGVMAAPENGIQFFFIVYWDGKKLRAYLPTEGNLWDYDNKSMYGMEGEYDHLPNLRKRFPELAGLLKKELTLDSKIWSEMYFSEDKLIEDIKQRIQVSGTTSKK